MQGKTGQLIDQAKREIEWTEMRFLSSAAATLS
jgi:hypothetical protein